MEQLRETPATRLCEVTLATGEENLALDEALFLARDQSLWDFDILRLWEARAFAVVLGRGSPVASEVDRSACQRWNIPILRRTSGGAAVMLGPGCLVYSLVLGKGGRNGLQAPSGVHRHVLERVIAALAALGENVQAHGTSDLVRGGRKFSGNSLRIGRQAILYHGTILYNFPLELVELCLRLPARRPPYRGNRSHRDFLTNLPLDAASLRSALARVFSAALPLEEIPRDLVDRALQQRFGREAWHLAR